MQLLDSTVPLSKFTPHIAIATYDGEGNDPLPDNVIESFVRNSAISFSEKTGVITKTVKIDLQCGLDCYPILLRGCDTIIGIKSAKMGDWCETECNSMSWSWGDVSFRLDDDVLHIWPAPTKDVHEGIELEVVVSPSRDACEIDAQLYDKWFDAIVHGALAELHALPSRSFSSTTRADYRRRMFNEEVGRATVRRVLQGSREPMRMSPNANWMKCRTRQRRF